MEQIITYTKDLNKDIVWEHTRYYPIPKYGIVATNRCMTYNEYYKTDAGKYDIIKRRFNQK